MKHLAYALPLIALLAGCADKPAKDAVIEDRGIKAAATGEGTKPVETQAMGAGASADAKSLGNAGTAAPGEAAAARKVETHALPAATTEIKPLVSEKGDAATAVGDGQAAIALKLKDPASPLSKRVILFDYDSSAIRDEYRALLEAHAEFLKGTGASKVILQGNTDERGSREYNLALGQRRAESVYKALQLLGVGEPQMEAVSLGEEKPAATGNDETSWQQNRRTVILYQGE